MILLPASRMEMVSANKALCVSCMFFSLQNSKGISPPNSVPNLLPTSLVVNTASFLILKSLEFLDRSVMQLF